MPVYNRIAHFSDDMTRWRRSIHENPELGYEEVKPRPWWRKSSPRSASTKW